MKLLKTTGYLAAVAAIVFTLGCSDDSTPAGSGNNTGVNSSVYIVSGTIMGNGTISPALPKTVDANSSLTLNFTPISNDQLDSVKVNGTKVTLTGNQYTIPSITEHKSILAYFSTPTIQIPTVDGVWFSKDSMTYNGMKLTGDLTVSLNADKSFGLLSNFTKLIGDINSDSKLDTVVEPQLSGILKQLQFTNPTKISGTWRSSATHLFYKMAGSAVEDSSAYTLEGSTILKTSMKLPTPRNYTFTKK